MRRVFNEKRMLDDDRALTKQRERIRAFRALRGEKVVSCDEADSSLRALKAPW
jgi:hypothetical protein